ncbi:MAG: tetratricopeptide repeat protein [Candidatus Zixiibacteriota bacterium]|nr:MAG: tetratricopeptide repeat protein [candidate division Zixibacteria bacterium]
MTDQGSEVGLITKTVEKVEKNETSSVQPGTPLEPHDDKRRPRKRTLVLGAALLVIVIFLGLGYIFFLKPAAEPPERTPRRSITARTKPGRPAEAKKDAGASTADPSKQDGAAEQSSTTTDAAEGGGAETAAASEDAPEMSAAEQKLLSQPGMGPVTEGQTEPQVSSSSADESGQDQKPPVPENKGQISAEPVSGEEEGALPEEYIEDETLLFPPEESFLDQMTPSYPSDPGRGWTETQVEVTERSASRAERYYRKGASYQQEGKLSHAIESYTEALTFDPDHLQAHMNLATAYLQTSRFREAEQELAYLYAVKPKDPKVLFNFGLLLYRTGEYVSAEAKLRKLLEQDPFHLEANLLLASIYEERGGINKALELCMRAHQINSAHPRVLYRLGRAWDMVGDPAEAAKYYQLYLSTRSEKESQLELAVRGRLNYLLSQKEEKWLR